MPNTGDTTPARGDVYECWALLPALAAVTDRVRIGTLVTPTSVHHPALLANRAATIDRLSGGRMVLGLGAGWQINEAR
jgi:alkanesulfonate monooxygenase SsuD/methylene tetrahydromethanopterin reductase-like flavin-dependent oxidoreductase (luciferase family)